MRKVKNIEELADYIADEFSNIMLRLVKEKLDLFNQFKVAREKLGKDKYGNLIFSIEVTGDIRILYSVDPKTVSCLFGRLGLIRGFMGLSLFHNQFPELLQIFFTLNN